MTPKRGLFITIEGIEGAGKSTLAEALRDRLSSEGHEVILTREPGGGKIAEKIRELLLETDEKLSDRAELLLFEAARAQHIDDIIVPALDRSAVVICDRFSDSSVAYQGFARGIGFEAVQVLNKFATRDIRPDLTIVLDLPANIGLARQKKIDRISAENLAFHESVRDGYLAIAKAEPERLVVLDGLQSFETVLDHAWNAVKSICAEVGL